MRKSKWKTYFPLFLILPPLVQAPGVASLVLNFARWLKKMKISIRRDDVNTRKELFKDWIIAIRVFHTSLYFKFGLAKESN